MHRLFSAIVLSILLASSSSLAMNRGVPTANGACQCLCNTLVYTLVYTTLGIFTFCKAHNAYLRLFLTETKTKRIELTWKSGVSLAEKQAFLDGILGAKYKWRKYSAQYDHVDIDEKFALEAYRKLREEHECDRTPSKLDYVIINQVRTLSENYMLSPGEWRDGDPIYS